MPPHIQTHTHTHIYTHTSVFSPQTLLWKRKLGSGDHGMWHLFIKNKEEEEKTPTNMISDDNIK